MPKKQNKEWKECLEQYTSKVNAKGVFELLDNNRTLGDPVKYAFGGASLHNQNDDNVQHLTMYASHKDKVANVVLFYPLFGSSFNLLALPSATVKGEGETAKISEEMGSYCSYQKLKQSCDEVEFLQIEKFESDFLQKATKDRHPRVVV